MSIKISPVLLDCNFLHSIHGRSQSILVHCNDPLVRNNRPRLLVLEKTVSGRYGKVSVIQVRNGKIKERKEEKRRTMFVKSFPKISGLLTKAHIEKCVMYSSVVIPPFPTSSMSRSFHCPDPAFCTNGAAYSRMRIMEQSDETKDEEGATNEVEVAHGTQEVCN